MIVTLDLDPYTQQTFGQAFGQNLSQAAIEALTIEGYRARKFGIGAVRRLLGLRTRWETEAWLRTHEVPLNYSLDDFQADCRTLDQLRKA